MLTHYRLRNALCERRMTHLAFSGLARHSSIRRQRRAMVVGSEMPRWLEPKGRRGMSEVITRTPRLALLRWLTERFLSAVAAAFTTASCPLLRRSAITLRPLDVLMMFRE